MKTLFIDGPLRGQLKDLEHAPVIATVDPPTSIAEASSSGEAHFTQVAYHFHKCRIFGHIIRVGSVKADYPDEQDAWAWLISDQAKQADMLP